MSIPENEVLNNLVSRVFRVQDVTLGEPARGLIARYRGFLLTDDSEKAYDQLAESLKPYGITPLFRMDKGEQVVYLIPKRPDPKPTRPSINIILFILTVLSLLYVGGYFSNPDPHFTGLLSLLQFMISGWPYALSLISILLAHEFGHYLMSRFHKTPATLPYFIPFPVQPLGTMGAAILMQGTPKNKRVLFDIGVAGPLAGMLIALPILWFGLHISHLQVITPAPAGMVNQMEGNSILYLLAKYLAFGKLLPAPASYGNLTAFGYWIRYFFTGRPFPIGGVDIDTSAVAFAGWAGLLVTALNLIPAGTLDGGHVVYSWFGDKASKAFPIIFFALLALGLFWTGWWIWAVLLLWLGRVHAEPLDQITQLDPLRLSIAALAILIFIVTFSPVPFSIFSGL